MIDSPKMVELKNLITRMEGVLVAYSGGVDSTLLLKVAYDLLKEKVLAVTESSPLYPVSEIESAKRQALELGVRHLVIESLRLPPGLSKNPIERCYLCKKDLFGRLIRIAQDHGLSNILDGSNKDDSFDFRPGMKAAYEFGIRSPLAEVGLTKEEIRIICKEMGLYNWDKPSQACLASRFPYGEVISYRALRMVEEAEEYIKGLGIRQARSRHYGNLCRIELPIEEFPTILERRDEVVRNLKRLGYTYITLDLAGYRSGSMNEVLS